MKNAAYLREELTHHLPFTIFFGASGVLLAGMLTYHATVVDLASVGSGSGAATALHGHEHGGEARPGHDHTAPGVPRGMRDRRPTVEVASPVLFHVFHPVHMLFSAMATTAMFWRYDRRWLRAIVIGALGSAGVCGISDVVFPYVGGLLLGTKMSFHWCLIQEPQIVLPFLVVGILGGLVAEAAVQRSTVYSHSGHVFISSVASIFYLLSFGLHDWVNSVGYVFVIVVLAVMLPCCASDIVFPLVVSSADGAPVHCHSRYHEGHVHAAGEHDTHEHCDHEHEEHGKEPP